MTELYIHKSGAATLPPIVFLHGGGLSGRMWQPQLERLTDYHCLAPDLPEHARSAAIKPFTLHKTTVEIARLIRESVPSGRANIVGLSVGAAVGLELLRTYPEVVNRAILSGTTPKVGRRFAQVIDAINAPLLRLLPRQHLANTVIKMLGIPAPYNLTFTEDLQHINLELFRNVNLATAEVQIPTGAIPPTLMVVGEKETGFTKSHARTVSKTVEGVIGRVVKGAGHAWNLEDPDLFNAMIRAWFTETPLPPALRSLA